LRTTDASGSGQIITPARSLLAGVLQHVVSARKSDGSRTMWVDGREQATGTLTGGFAAWNVTYPLSMGNVPSADRPFSGEIHLVAIYARALTQAEVSQNYAAGPK
jgi:hypothetical protein